MGYAENLVSSHLRRTDPDALRRYQTGQNAQSLSNAQTVNAGGRAIPGLVRWNGSVLGTRRENGTLGYVGNASEIDAQLKGLGNTGGSGGGRGGRGGGGGGGGSAARRYNIQGFDEGDIRARAAAKADAEIAERIRQNTAARAQARLIAAREEEALNLQQQRDSGQLAGQHDVDTGRMNNIMQNTGFYGGSAYGNYAQQNNAYQSALSNLLAGYQTQRGSIQNSLLDRIWELEEADRVTNAQRPGLTEDYYGDMRNNAWDEWLQLQNLRMSAGY